MSSQYIQWSLYFKTTHRTKKMWSYIAGGPKIKVIYHRKLPFGTKSSGLTIKGGLKIEGCKIEGLLYWCMYMVNLCHGGYDASYARNSYQYPLHHC